MEDDFKKYVLENVPTKVLLREFKRYRWAYYMGRPTDEAYRHCDYFCDYRVKITVGKFASWNPNKGNTYIFYYSQDEAKKELDKREYIEKK